MSSLCGWKQELKYEVHRDKTDTAMQLLVIEYRCLSVLRYNHCGISQFLVFTHLIQLAYAISIFICNKLLVKAQERKAPQCSNSTGWGLKEPQQSTACATLPEDRGSLPVGLQLHFLGIERPLVASAGSALTDTDNPPGVQNHL